LIESDISVLIITYNEEQNIDRILKRLAWAREILLIDSFSSDRTLDIIKRYKNTRVLQRSFDSFADQCNFGLKHINTKWVLSIDSDYLINADVVAAIRKLDPIAEGYSFSFKYCVFGKPLRGTLLPPRTCLYMVNSGTYINDGHAHRVQINGIVKLVKGCYIFHDDRKSISRWLKSQDKYLTQEAEKLLNMSFHELSFADKIRKYTYLSPLLVFFYYMFFKKGLLDGKEGWYYVAQRITAEYLLIINLIEHRKNQK